jgi:DNA-binding NarL/FixJ family response regulator
MVEAIDAFIGRSNRPEAFPQLTRREREILDHIARGQDNLQIAAHLELSEKTVRNHITAIFAKIGVENRGQAIVQAREAGLGDEGRRPPGP